MSASTMTGVLGSVKAAEKGEAPVGEVASACKQAAVLFDFDGTLGDTETPAMEVAYWELAPYFAGINPAGITEAAKSEFIRDNAGKAFEFMMEVADEARAKAGMSSITEVNVNSGKKVTTYICGLMESNKWKTPSDKTPVCSRSPPLAFLAPSMMQLVTDRNDRREARCNELGLIQQAKAAKSEDPAVLAVVDEARARFGLPTFKAMRSGEAREEADFLTMQKDETVDALKTLAKPCPGVPSTLEVRIGA
eukprot:1184894-Prorocentrum_minimum.AAC.2